jgi:hypothetical protein
MSLEQASAEAMKMDDLLMSMDGEEKMQFTELQRKVSLLQQGFAQDVAGQQRQDSQIASPRRFTVLFFAAVL